MMKDVHCLCVSLLTSCHPKISDFSLLLIFYKQNFVFVLVSPEYTTCFVFADVRWLKVEQTNVLQTLFDNRGHESLIAFSSCSASIMCG